MSDNKTTHIYTRFILTTIFQLNLNNTTDIIYLCKT